MQLVSIHTHGAPVQVDAVLATALPEKLPQQLPEQGYLWLACSRESFAANSVHIQAWLTQCAGRGLAELHVSDLQNPQLPSHYDASSDYDLVVFQRLVQTSQDATPTAHNSNTHASGRGPAAPSGTPKVPHIQTTAVGFAVFDRVLLSVHPSDCQVLRAYTARLLGHASPAASAPDLRSAGARGIPHSPADMMLRMLSHMVDAYLELRRDMSQQLEHWQNELIRPRGRFSHWAGLLRARRTLHQLDALCEDQRTALQDWLAGLSTWGAQSGMKNDKQSDKQGGLSAHALELLTIRCRDVIEHIERVIQHMRRLEHSTEDAVQMHFNVQGSRTNDSMRTLTAITAIFLPMNLIAAIFGMNFEFMPWLHRAGGFWWALGAMALLAIGLVLVFWRKHYLSRLEP